MSLIKLGSQLRILKTAASVEELVMDRPLEEKVPGTKIIEPKHSDFLYYRARAISAGDQGPIGKDGSRTWNYNGNFDFFSRKQLEASYESFVGRNIFLDHNSESSLYSIGKLIDAVPVDDPETGEFYIEIVGKIDRTLHPEICRKIETGELNSTSMGCSVDESMCSICGHILHSDADEKCEHMGMNLGKKFEAEVDIPEANIKKGDIVPCFSINSGIVFNEDSIVGVPADPSAVIKTVLSNMRHSLNKKASLTDAEKSDFVKQFETLLSKVDSDMAIKLKAEFCGICPPPIKESSMSDTNLPNDEQKKILSKISALEMEQLESYVAHKTKKASEVANKEIIADAVSKEETFLSKIVAKVKDSFAAQLLEKKIETVAKEELKKEDKKHTKECMDANEHAVGGDCICDAKKVSAKFQEDKNNVLDSTWSVYEGDKCLLDASLKDIWGAQFELLSFDDQKWATSEAYGREAIARYQKEGVEKLADLWDVSHKLNKTAKGPELGPDGSYAKPNTGLSNKEHNVKNSPVTKPGQEVGQKGPSAPKPIEVKTETKIDMPGQEKGQTGPAAPKAKEVKTDYSEPKPEAEGKEVKTTPKNPEEKKMEKSEKEVKTDYVAEGKEHMEEEEKGSKKEEKKASVNYKEANAQIKWSAMSPEAQEFIKKHVKKHIDEDGMKQDQAVAAAYSEAREKGMDVPSSPKKASTLPEGTKEIGQTPDESSKESTLPKGTKEIGDIPQEASKGSTLPEGTKEIGQVPQEAVEGKVPSAPEVIASQEIIMNKTAADKPTESVDGSTLPEGKKEVGDKAEESAKGETQPKGKAQSADPVMAVEDGKGKKTTNLTKAPEESVDGSTLTDSKKSSGDKSEQSSKEDTEPKGTKSVGDSADAAVKKASADKPEEAVQGTTLPAADKTMGDKAEQSSQGDTQPEGTDVKKPVDEAVKKEAATEMPMPEDKPAIEEEIKVEDVKPELPVEAPKVDAPHEEVSAFDKAEKLDIGEGYSAHKNKETKEVVIEKDGKEVKRLPDGFGAEVSLVLPLLKAVLGLPPEATNKMDMPDMTKPMDEAPKVEEHPALEEAHEDELGIKESSLKAKEAELLKKEAEIKAKEEEAHKVEASKKFAAIIQARSERCKKIVADMVAKDAIKMDETVYQEERKVGTYLLDAQKKAFEAALSNKHKELLAMDDNALLAMEKVISDIKTPVVKKANHIFVSPSYGEELSEDQQLKRIFDSMGDSKKRPQ